MPVTPRLLMLIVEPLEDSEMPWVATSADELIDAVTTLLLLIPKVMLLLFEKTTVRSVCAVCVPAAMTL